MSEVEIAESIGLNTTQLRTQMSLAKDLANLEKRAQARKLRDEGKSLKEIAKEMGYSNDSSVRSLLNENTTERMEAAMNLANFLKEQVETKGAIDVGLGVEQSLPLGTVSREKMKEALYILEMEGYPTYKGGVKQGTNQGQQTNMWVLCKPETTYPQFYALMKTNGVKTIEDYESHDRGDTFDPKWVYPASLDSKRLAIRYAEDDGVNKDGVVEIRRNVPDLNLGGSNYCQVRILVDGTHYIKGMAVYADDKDLPPGVDILFNTNKTKDKSKMEVLKSIDKNIKKDPNNPFGSLIKEGIFDPNDPTSNSQGGQSYYYDEHGNKKLSLINKASEAGDWGEWGDSLPSQFLSKQPMKLINSQLKMSIDDKVMQYKDILEVNNPVVRRSLLLSFADDCDASSVDLKAASLPRQKYQVILPLTSIGDNEVYAPNYNNGEKVALIRYPHGGLFEIPILTVNNNNKEGQRVIGKNAADGARDAIGITKKVADRLSGADFDGDTVTVIPISDKVNIKNQPPFRNLINFDNKLEYSYTKEQVANGEFLLRVKKYKKDKMSDEAMAKAENLSVPEFKDKVKSAKKNAAQLMRNTQTEMGIISNLITDMTLEGATPKELERAVRHSMVVIDAEKHNLNYKKSELDNGIAELKKKYQINVAHDGEIKYGGASTLISRAKSEQSVSKRQGSPKINIPGTTWYDPTRPEGALVYKTADDLQYIDRKTGKIVTKTQPSTKMAETDDARSLISSARTPQEKAYAEYANKLKSMANEARKEAYFTKGTPYSAEAAQKYKKEVSELNAALSVAEKNKPKERQANLMANAAVEEAKVRDPNLSKKDIGKIAQRALTEARAKVGASGRDTKIRISDDQWKAIQAGAISTSKLSKIILNADKDRVKELATPKTRFGMSTAQKARLKDLARSGYTNAQIANVLGVSVSTVSKFLTEN